MGQQRRRAGSGCQRTEVVRNSSSLYNAPAGTSTLSTGSWVHAHTARFAPVSSSLQLAPDSCAGLQWALRARSQPAVTLPLGAAATQPPCATGVIGSTSQYTSSLKIWNPP